MDFDIAQTKNLGISPKNIVLSILIIALVAGLIVMKIWGFDIILGGKLLFRGTEIQEPKLTKKKLKNLDVSIFQEPQFKELNETRLDKFDINQLKLGKRNPFVSQ